jgi:hypothetical protein
VELVDHVTQGREVVGEDRLLGAVADPPGFDDPEGNHGHEGKEEPGKQEVAGFLRHTYLYGCGRESVARGMLRVP